MADGQIIAELKDAPGIAAHFAGISASADRARDVSLSPAALDATLQELRWWAGALREARSRELVAP